MNVAIAKMTEGYRSAARDHCCDRRGGIGDKIRHRVHRHRGVMLDRSAFIFLRVGDVMAQEPKGLGLLDACCNGRVLDQRALDTRERDPCRKNLLHQHT